MNQAIVLDILDVRQIGADIRLRAKVNHADDLWLFKHPIQSGLMGAGGSRRRV